MSAQTGATVRDVSAQDFVKAYAQHLKRQGKIELPKWVDYQKTGVFKELSPTDPDWYYIRAASIARKVYLRKGTGVGALQKVYGGRYRNGCRKEHFRKASPGVIRNVLAALEALKVVEKVPKGKGRQITRLGQQDLDRIAGQLVRSKKDEDDEDDDDEDDDDDDEDDDDDDDDDEE